MGLVIKSVVLTYLLALYFFLQNKLVLFGKEVFFLKIREYTYRGGVEREYIIWNWIPIIIFIVMGVALIYFVIIPTSSTQTTTNTKDVEEIEEVDEDED